MHHGKKGFELATLLESLGDTPEAVAESLTKAECSGHQGMPGYCPVAVFIQRQMHVGPGGAVVQPSLATVYDSGVPNGGRSVASLPSGCFHFVNKFDRGEFPQLVRGGLTYKGPTS
jgi:hypothetical protein